MKLDKFFVCTIVLAVIATAVLCVSLYASPNLVKQNDGTQVIASYGEGKLYKTGSVCITELHGSYRDMGRQYGALRKDDLNAIYDSISGDYGKRSYLDYENLSECGQTVFTSSPERYRQMIYGISETSGLSVDELMVLEGTEMYVVLKDSLGGCSYVAAWGNYTPDGTLVLGRNYDWGHSMNNYVNVMVLNPDDGSIPFASVTYTGCTYLTSGMNKQGIFMELNNGGLAVSGQDYDNRTAAYCSLLTILENAGDMGDADMMFSTISPQSESIINVADKNGSYSYEWGKHTMMKRSPDYDGLIAATNHFVDPYWGENETVMSLRDDLHTIERRHNLLDWGNRYKGNVTEDTVKQMISTPLENGGVLFDNPAVTAYEIVAVPQNLTMAVRIPGVQEWTDIDLNRYFT